MDPNEDQIVELEDTARQHRVEMAAMKIRLLSAEQRLDDILSGRVAIPNVNSVQAADTEHRASVEVVSSNPNVNSVQTAATEHRASVGSLPFVQPPSPPMQPLVVSSSEIEDGK